MRRFKLLFFCIVVSNVLLSQPAEFLDNIYYYIENTSVFEMNQEKEGRTYYLPNKSISLNVEWKFFYSETPEGIATNFYIDEFNDKKWSFITVPSNWKMVGYGDRIFRTQNAPFNYKNKMVLHST